MARDARERRGGGIHHARDPQRLGSLREMGGDRPLHDAQPALPLDAPGTEARIRHRQAPLPRDRPRDLRGMQRPARHAGIQRPGAHPTLRRRGRLHDGRPGRRPPLASTPSARKSCRPGARTRRSPSRIPPPTRPTWNGSARPPAWRSIPTPTWSKPCRNATTSSPPRAADSPTTGWTPSMPRTTTSWRSNSSSRKSCWAEGRAPASATSSTVRCSTTWP